MSNRRDAVRELIDTGILDGIDDDVPLLRHEDAPGEPTAYELECVA